jgi:hypothetical protein
MGVQKPAGGARAILRYSFESSPNCPGVAMTSVNPHASPKATTSKFWKTPPPTRLAFLVSGILLAFGVFFLLLLDGQVFTNTLVFLWLCTASCLVWVGMLPVLRGKDRERLATYVILAHVVLIAAFSLTLPAKSAWQRGFNNRARETREPTRQEDDNRSESKTSVSNVDYDDTASNGVSKRKCTICSGLCRCRRRDIENLPSPLPGLLDSDSTWTRFGGSRPNAWSTCPYAFCAVFVVESSACYAPRLPVFLDNC